MSEEELKDSMAEPEKLHREEDWADALDDVIGEEPQPRARAPGETGNGVFSQNERIHQRPHRIMLGEDQEATHRCEMGGCNDAG